MGGPGSGPRKGSSHVRGKESGTSSFRFMSKESRRGSKRVLKEMHYRQKTNHTVRDVKTVFTNPAGNKFRPKKEISSKTYVGRKAGRKA